MTRSLRVLVLLSQVAAWALGAGGLCLCADRTAADAAGCCERVSRSGEDCCAPARDQLASASPQAFERAAPLSMPAPLAFVAYGVTLAAVPAVGVAAPVLSSRPALVLRI